MEIVDVFYRAGKKDAEGERLLQEIREDLQLPQVKRVHSVVRYMFEGDWETVVLTTLGERLLADPLEQSFSLEPHIRPGCWEIIVLLNPDVTDNIGRAAQEAARDVRGGKGEGIPLIRVGRKYLLEGELEESVVQRICKDLLANPVIETYTFHPPVSEEGGKEATPGAEGGSTQ